MRVHNVWKREGCVRQKGGIITHKCDVMETRNNYNESGYVFQSKTSWLSNQTRDDQENYDEDK